MAKKKAYRTPVIVTIKEGRNKTQPWTFSIDDVGPGPKTSVKERYVKAIGAKKGALRKLKAVTADGTSVNKACGLYDHEWFTPEGRYIKFMHG